jgi:hypothetical protein
MDLQLIREAGPPIWFVLVCGTYTLVQAIRYRARAASGGELAGAVVATLLFGALGTAYGMQLAFAGMRQLPDPASQHWIAFVGVKEALCNFDVACAFGITASLVATVGRRRDAVASAS